MRISERKGNGEIRRNGRAPERAPQGCVECGEIDPEFGLDRHGLCLECEAEDTVARKGIAALIDAGLGVSRAAVEAL